ncbi:MAG TPA: RNA-binding domain-containing protein [Candidatus Nitrosotalea sp.]|nr:RNA-binding domain-containing protein [Candidatus Nitrosotalea sp.]
MTHQLEITAEVILHATEDNRKIFEPIFDLFQINEDEFTIEKTLGHYGNTIILAKITLVKKRAEEFIKKLASKIPKAQMKELIENMDMHFEDTSLFLRIGKNEIVRKEISLQQNNAIKIKIKMPVYKKDQISKKYIELLTV